VLEINTDLDFRFPGNLSKLRDKNYIFVGFIGIHVFLMVDIAEFAG
jgi:hypothetical protein